MTQQIQESERHGTVFFTKEEAMLLTPALWKAVGAINKIVTGYESKAFEIVSFDDLEEFNLAKDFVKGLREIKTGHVFESLEGDDFLRVFKQSPIQGFCVLKYNEPVTEAEKEYYHHIEQINI